MQDRLIAIHNLDCPWRPSDVGQIFRTFKLKKNVEVTDNGKIIIRGNGGRYERQGDYLIPCLTLPAEEEQPIGVWGERHLRYLKEYRRGTYINLLTSGRLKISLNRYKGSITYGRVRGRL